jgi:hypothetical protein
MWVIAGLVALMLIIGGLFTFGEKGDTTASNTGPSGTTTMAPANRPAPPANPAR